MIDDHKHFYNLTRSTLSSAGPVYEIALKIEQHQLRAALNLDMTPGFANGSTGIRQHDGVHNGAITGTPILKFFAIQSCRPFVD
jgi:hypothetical protein